MSGEPGVREAEESERVENALSGGASAAV